VAGVYIVNDKQTLTAGVDFLPKPSEMFLQTGTSKTIQILQLGLVWFPS
jgi:hypothetical protein